MERRERQSCWAPSDTRLLRAVTDGPCPAGRSWQVLRGQWITWILGLLQAHGDSQARVQLPVDLHLLQGQPPSASDGPQVPGRWGGKGARRGGGGLLWPRAGAGALQSGPEGSRLRVAGQQSGPYFTAQRFNSSGEGTTCWNGQTCPDLGRCKHQRTRTRQTTTTPYQPTVALRNPAAPAPPASNPPEQQGRLSGER